MKGIEEKSTRTRRLIIFCAAASAAALVFALSGWNDKWTLATTTVAAVCIFYATLSRKKMYDDAIRDSAERVKTLEHDLQFFKDIYELNPAMLFTVDDNLSVTDCNMACIEFVGADTKMSLMEELTNKIEADIPRHTLLDGFTESMAETIRKAGRDGFSHINTLLTIRDGTHRNISVSFRKIPAEKGFILTGASVDTTEMQRVKEELSRKNKMLDLVNRIAILMSSIDSGNAYGMVRKAAEIMGRVMDVDRIYLWKYLLIDGIYHYAPEFMWIRPSVPDNLAMMAEEGFTCVRSIADWETCFENGECINGPLSTLSDNERERLAPYGIKSILVLPLFLRNKFRGFISFDDCRRERVFAEEEVYILRSASLMITSSLLGGGMEYERETTTKPQEVSNSGK